MKKLLIAITVVLAFPSVADAGLVTMLARDVPLGPRSLLAASAPMSFNMLGVHWRGSGEVEYRTRTTVGRWRPWQAVDADPNAPETQPGWHDGNLDWVGASAGIQFKTAGLVSRVRAYYLWSKVTTPARRTLSLAGSPAIVPRSSWFADEQITRAKPLYATVLKLAIVHHTAETNSYTPAQAAAIVRGIEVYHVKANGWNDIGYNFLVDRYGTVYEGRGGGIDKNVIGAHSLGFNRGTVGVALMGNFSAAEPPRAMQSALVNLLAWRLDVAHVDPLARVVYTSGGNTKLRAGKIVTLRAISGHRDTGPTECPGNRAYALLPALTRRVSLTGLPKLYSPVVSGSLGSPVRFQGRLSSPRPWTVTVTDATGAVAAQGKGSNATVDWTWSSAGAVNGPYGWSIDGGPSVLPASGTIGVRLIAVPPPPVVVAPPPVVVTNPLTGLTASPAVVSPSPDGTGGYVTVDFTLAAAATVTVKLTSATPVTAVPLTLLAAGLPAGDNSFSWSLAAVPDGRYQVVVTATPKGGAAATQSAPVAVDRTLTGYAVTPALISPNGDGTNDAVTFTFTLAQPVPVQILVEQLGGLSGTIFSGSLGSGPQSLVWNGTINGVRVPDGVYEAVAVVSDGLGSPPFVLPLTVDTTPPTLTLLDAATLRFQLSEPATVTVTIDGQAVVRQEPQGAFTIPWQGGPVATISAQADDAAGNLSATVSVP
jgi:hypothetical protein